MESPKPATQSQERNKRPALWIAWIVALAAIVALIVCLVSRPERQPTPVLEAPPTPEGGEVSITHTVTIMPAAAGCSVKPSELKDVGLPDQVCFTNQTASPIVIDFSSPELFGTTSITVPPASTVCIHVGGKAKPGTVYEYSVSCLPPVEARPRIVIRSTQQ